MIKKILVAQDGSEYSSSTASYAVMLGRAFGAELTGIHVVDVVFLEGPFIQDVSASMGVEPLLNVTVKVRQALEARGASILDTFKESCRSSGVRADSVLASGIISNEIVDKARLADLVVMGRRGAAERFEHGLLGSVSEAVIRKSPKPVFIAPKTFVKPERPLLAYDGSEHAAKAMHRAAEWAKTLALPLTVLHASREGGSSTAAVLKEAEDYIRPYGIKASFVAVVGEATLSIENYAKDHGHDLIFLGASRHSRLMSLVLGSTAEHLLRTLKGPFLLER